MPEWISLHPDTVHSETIDQFKSKLLPPPSSALRPPTASPQLTVSIHTVNKHSHPLGLHTPPGGPIEYLSRQDKSKLCDEPLGLFKL